MLVMVKRFFSFLFLPLLGIGLLVGISKAEESEVHPPDTTAYLSDSLYFDTTQFGLQPQLKKTYRILKDVYLELKNKSSELVNRVDKKVELSQEQQKLKAHTKFQELVKNFTNIPVIDPEIILETKDSVKYVFIDVREAEEQKVSMIPGALTTKEFRDRYKSPSDLDSVLVVVYCTLGYRSAAFAEQLKKYQIQAWNLKAGITGWAFAHGPLVEKSGPNQYTSTKKIHTYSAGWNILPPNYEAIY